jgi:hypothetical protein
VVARAKRRASCGHQVKGICATCRRAQQRFYAQRARDRELAKRIVGAAKCPKGFCGGHLETTTDAIGRTVVVCAWCVRKARGICRDCPAPVDGTRGKALRCAIHARERQNANVRAYAERHHETVNARARAYYQTDPEKRAKSNEYKRQWRKANREKVRAQKRRAALRQPKRVREYMARYRKKHREHYREAQRCRYYAEHPVRPDPHCTNCGKAIVWEPPGRPYLTCDECCWPYQLRQREAKRAAHAAAITNAPVVPERPKPVKVRRPKARNYNQNGERLCLGDGCTTIVTGRTKKCEPCKQHERELAAAAIRARVAAYRQRRRAA